MGDESMGESAGLALWAYAPATKRPVWRGDFASAPAWTFPTLLGLCRGLSPDARRALVTGNVLRRACASLVCATGVRS